MSYALGAALQTAVYQTLMGDTALAALVGGAIYDALPAGALPDTYVTLGPETIRDRSDKTGYGAQHRFVVSVISSEPGFSTAKQAAQAVGDALIDADLALTRGRLVDLRFDRAKATRESTGAIRRIDLTFRARVSDET